MDVFITIVRPLTDLVGIPPEALPMAIMRPLSGSGSLGIMTETMQAYGTDGFIGVLVSTLYGSTETNDGPDPAVDVMPIYTDIALGVRPSVAGVNQQGLARWRDEERRVAAFDVDQVDLEAVLSRQRDGENKQGQNQKHCAHR